MALNIVINLVYTPVMLRTLGSNEYGLYQTVASTISMLSILSLGFNSSYVRYYAKYKLTNDKKSIEKLNGLFLIIFSIIGCVALVCGLFIAFNLDLIFSTGLTENEYVLAKKLMIISTLNLSLMFSMSVFQNIVSANERYIVLKLFGMLKTVLSPLICIPLLLNGFNSVALVSTSFAVSVLTDLLYAYYVIRVLKNKFVFHNFPSGIVKSLFTYTFFIALNMIVDQINMNIDKLLLGRYKGTGETAVYSVGFTLYHLYQSFSTSVSSVFTPRIHQIVNATKDNMVKQRNQLTELFTKVGRVQFLILGLISTGIFFFGHSFITDYWAGEGYDNSYVVAILLIFSGSIALVQNTGIEIQRALNKHQFRSIVYMIMALFNLGLSIILCQLYGAVGSAVGTAISLVLANGLIINIYYHKRCNINILFFFKNILRMALGLIPPCIIGFFLNHYIDLSRFSHFVLAVLVYALSYALSVWFISMNNYEKSIFLKPVRLVLDKIKK